MANAIAGVGTVFERWNGAGWDTIAEINSIEGPSMDKDIIEVTSLDTAGGYDEFITGFMDGGQLTLNMNFSRSGYELMKQDFEIDVARDYRITLPDDEDTTLEFEGLVIEIPLTMEADNQLTVDVIIQVSGEVTIASAGAESSGGGSQSWEDYWATQDLNLWVKSRSGLSLIDSFGNNPTLLPAVWDITNANQQVAPISAITINAGYIDIDALYPTPSVSYLIAEPTHSNFIALMSATSIRVRCQGTIKDFVISAPSTTELTRFRIAFRQDSGSTKVRVYTNTIESSSGEQSFGAGISFTGVNRIGAAVGKMAYININNGTNDILTYHLTGLGKYVYDASGNSNHGTHTNALATTYLAGGSTYLMDNDFTIYEHYYRTDVYVPDAHTTAINTLLAKVAFTGEYQVKEAVTGSLTKYNLAPALIQMQGSIWDRSDISIWKDEARSGYYDSTNADTKKRWHSTEFNQATFKSWLQDDYKEIVFAKFNDNTFSSGRILSEIMAFDIARTGNELTKTYAYINYGYAVTDLTATFDVSTISGQLSWTDVFGGTASYEIWVSVEGRTKTYVATTAIGATSYNDNTCKQGAWVKYYIRPRVNTKTYSFSPASIIYTPLCLKTDQSTLTQVVFKTLNISAGGSVTINWGDESTTVLSAGENYNKTHDYAIQNQYSIWLSGNVKRIYNFEHLEQAKSYGDIANWVIPWDCVQFHPYKCGFTGDISDHANWFSPNLLVYDLQYLAVTGDISDWRLGDTNIYDIHFEYTNVTGDLSEWTFRATPTDSLSAKIRLSMTDLSGDISSWDLFDGLNWLDLDGGDFELDVSKFNIPDSCVNLSINSNITYTNRIFGDASGFTFPTADGINYHIALNRGEITGDMSACLLPELTKNGSVSFSHNQITKMPRGHFKYLTLFDFSYNQCDTSEIDSFLAYVDSYFTGGVVPMTNGVYLLNGTGMGIPSASGLASKASIESKYTAAGKTCTIIVNS